MLVIPLSSVVAMYMKVEFTCENITPISLIHSSPLIAIYEMKDSLLDKLTGYEKLSKISFSLSEVCQEENLSSFQVYWSN